MGSDNPSGADDQQETEIPLELDALWVVGFVDGEGCYSVAIHANRGAPHGWQLTPVFQVYQHNAHRSVLEGLQRFFGCGWIRPKGPASSVLTHGVQKQDDLLRCVVPFFERHPPLVKREAFAAFATIVRSQRKGAHRERAGFESLVRLAYGMNAQGRQRTRRIEQILGSSETVRQARPSN